MPGRGLADSRWAPENRRKSSEYASTWTSTKTPNTWPDSAPWVNQPVVAMRPTPPNPPRRPTSHVNTSLSAAQELARYTKIVRRLKWKLPYLAAGYHKATDTNDEEEVRAEAELMLKLDFFEYYMLIERALVHLLGVFGISVPSGATDGVIVNGRGGYERQHRFHQNVLEALNDRDNPLHTVLGTGDVYFALCKAKDLRNRWKRADEEHPRDARVGLQAYDLEGMLELIFAGFDAGYEIAQARVDGMLEGDSCEKPGEGQWDFMVDAMDWEAV